ncbi:hypothetical protein ACLBOM_15985 [Escherichia coli]
MINLFILDDVSEKMEYIPDWMCSYPVKHLVALINLAGHILLNAVTVPYRESEIVVFKCIVATIPDNSIALFYKFFTAQICR